MCCCTRHFCSTCSLASLKGCYSFAFYLPIVICRLHTASYIPMPEGGALRRDMVAFAEVGFKNASRPESHASVTPAAAFFLCNCQERRPVSRGDVCVRILLRGLPSARAVKRVQHSEDAVRRRCLGW